jgi:hypothetical protein
MSRSQAIGAAATTGRARWPQQEVQRRARPVLSASQLGGRGVVGRPARHRDEVDTVAVPPAVRQVVAQVRAVRAHLRGTACMLACHARIHCACSDCKSMDLGLQVICDCALADLRDTTLEARGDEWRERPLGQVAAEEVHFGSLSV